MSTKNLITATMMILSHSILALDLSGGVSGSRTSLELNTTSKITPNFTIDELEHSGIIALRDVHYGFHNISADLYGHYEYKDMIGIYGHIALSSFVENDQITNLGSLKCSMKSMMPSIDFGGYLFTQSGSKAALGLKLSWLGFDLKHLNDGLDFNGYTAVEEKGLSSYTSALTLQLAVPLTENFETYLSTDYGLSFGSITLQGAKSDISSLAQPSPNQENVGIGNMYGLITNVVQSSVSIGTRFTFKEI